MNNWKHQCFFNVLVFFVALLSMGSNMLFLHLIRVKGALILSVRLFLLNHSIATTVYSGTIGVHLLYHLFNIFAFPIPLTISQCAALHMFHVSFASAQVFLLLCLSFERFVTIWRWRFDETTTDPDKIS